MSKLVFDKSEIMTAVEKAIGATTDKSTIKVLNNIIMRPINGKIKVLSSNLAVLFGCTIHPKSGSAEGEDICVEGKLLYDALKRLQGNEVTIETHENHVLITAGEAQLQFQNYDCSDFPDGAFYKEEEVRALIKMKREAIEKILRYISFCIGVDENRPIIKCINFCIQDNNLTAVALDGFQIGLINVKVESEQEAVFNILGDSFKLLPSFFKGYNQDITVKIGKKFAIFTCGNIEAYILLNDGKFLDYSSLLPEEFEAKIEGKRENFLKSLDLVTLTRDEEGNKVTLKIADDNIRLTTQSNANSCTDIVKDTEIEGSDLIVRFNAFNMMSALKAIEEENVRILIGKKPHPLVVQNDYYFSFFMPLHQPQDQTTEKQDEKPKE